MDGGRAGTALLGQSGASRCRAMFQYAPPRISALSYVQLVLSDTLQAELMQATQLRATLEQLLRQEPPVEPLRLVQVRECD